MTSRAMRRALRAILAAVLVVVLALGSLPLVRAANSAISDLDALEILLQVNRITTGRHSVVAGEAPFIHVDSLLSLQIIATLPKRQPPKTSARLVAVLSNSKGSSQSYAFVVPRSSDKEVSSGQLTSIIDFSSVAATRFLYDRNGTYDLSLYAYYISAEEDSKIVTSATDSRKIATVSMSLMKQPSFTDDEYFIRPDQPHIFRPDPAPPKRTISLVFCVALLGLWVPLLGAWSRLGLNIRGVTTSGLLFAGLLAGYGAFLYTYWLRLTLFDFIYYGPLIGVGLLAALISTLSKASSKFF